MSKRLSGYRFEAAFDGVSNIRRYLQNLNLFADTLITIDGSKFKAVNNRDKSFTKGKVELRMKEVEDSLNQYFKDLETADSQEPEIKQHRNGSVSAYSYFRPRLF
ncbi:hypothetical protein ACO0KY_19190 [Undibacterium sp. Dicai25W]|uniref:hypothetical protein n=1 Tax=Undibacterium sp. Dicai25W TaxID=3413034 RepID=UPI003BF3BBE7